MLRRLLLSSLVLLSSAAVVDTWLSSMRPAAESKAIAISAREPAGQVYSVDMRRSGPGEPSTVARVQTWPGHDLASVAPSRFAAIGLTTGSLGRATEEDTGWHAPRASVRLSPSQLATAIQSELVRAGCLRRSAPGVWDANTRSALVRALAEANARMPVGAPHVAHLALLRGESRIACGRQETPTPHDIGSTIIPSRAAIQRRDGIMGLGAGVALGNDLPRSNAHATASSRVRRDHQARRGHAASGHPQDSVVDERLRYPLGRY